MERRLILTLVLTIGITCAASPHAQSQQSFDPVTAGARGLERAANFPWYDRDEGVVPVDVRPARNSLENRSSTWLREPPQTTTQRRNWNWGNWNTGASSALEGVGWFLLAALLAALVAVLVWALLQRDRRRSRATSASTLNAGKEAHAAQIENLPFTLEPSELDLLTEARRHFEQGNYQQAIIYLFSYELVQLDHRQLVRLARGKTNRQYLRELRSKPRLRSLVEETMVRFEDVFFGGRNLSRDQFTTCWNHLSEFHQQVEQPAT